MQKLLTALVLAALGQSALAQQLELFSGGTPGGNGPTTTPGAATFQLSTGSTTTAFTPATTVTYSFSGQNYTSNGTPGMVAGGTSVGATSSAPGATDIFTKMSSIGEPSNSHYTSDPFGTAGTGIDTGLNEGMRMYTDVTYLNGQNLSNRYEYGNLTLTFSRPVLNPVIHISGIGGYTYTNIDAAGKPTNFLGFYSEFQLATAAVSAGYTLTRLSGSTHFQVPTTGSLANIAINNNSTTPTGIKDFEFYQTQSAGNNGSGGSVRVNTGGTPITSITFRVFVRGDGGAIGTTGNSWLATNTPRAGDGFNISVSLPTYSLSGNVFNDVNGLTDNLVNGVNTPLPTLYANLVASNGTLFKSTQVTNGTYSFPNVVADDYTVVLTTSATSTTAALPATWSNTGENWAAPTVAGNDGNANGRLAVTVGASSTQTNVTNANFAIQQPPTAGSGVVSGILNPGGTQQYTVTQVNYTNTSVSSDPAPGTVTSIRITAFPTGATSIFINGTQYTASSTVWTSGGVILNTNSSGQPTAGAITVDPAASGVTQVSIPFVARDAAGAESANTGTAVINFVDLTISGTVHNDANGGTIDGPGIGAAAPTGSTIATRLYANLVNSSGVVIATRAIDTAAATRGDYSFGNASGVEANTTYTVVLSTTQGIVNTSTGATSTIPGGWVRTAEGQGGTTGDGTVNGIQSVAVVTTSVVDRDFAIERVPNSDDKSYTISPSPTQGQIYVLNGATNNGTGGNPPFLTGSDPEDQATSATLSGKTVRITSLPTNGQLWYGQTPTQITTVGFTINNFDPAYLQFRAVGGGYTTTSFRYAYVDAAGFADPTPALYTLTWNIPLAIEDVRFSATAAGCDAKITWQAASAKTSRYDVEFSRTGEARDFATVMSMEAGKATYETVYAQPQGEGFYRLRITEASGAVSFSGVRSVRTSCGAAATVISLFPNPTQNVVTVNGLQSGSVLRLFDLNGKVVIATTASSASSVLDLGSLAAGTYQLVVTANETTDRQTFKVVKQ